MQIRSGINNEFVSTILQAKGGGSSLCDQHILGYSMLRRSLSDKQYLDLSRLSSFMKTDFSITLNDWAVVPVSYHASNRVYELLR